MNNFKARQTECVHGKGMPGKYVMVEMWDQYAGLGNQFPSMITGDELQTCMNPELGEARANAGYGSHEDRQLYCTAPPCENVVQWLF